MVAAFGHLIGAWFVGTIVERVSRKKLRQLEWALLLTGGILPDVDFLFEWGFDFVIHRQFSHSLAFAIISGILAYSLSKTIPSPHARPTWAALVLPLGIITHLMLDMLTDPVGVQLFWPSLLWTTTGGTGIGSHNDFWTNGNLAFFVFDAGLGTAWLFYLLLRGKLRL